MYQLKFTLKQHTPIIHFQHDQDGATLRATEVKPKLDRFIIMKIGKEKFPNITDSAEIYIAGFNIAKENKWLVGSGVHGALDYKIKIETATNNNDYFLPLPLSPNEGRITNLNSFLTQNSNNNIQILAPTSYFANSDKIKYDRDEIKDETIFEELKIGVLSKSETIITITSFKSDLLNEIDLNICGFFLLNNFGTRQDKGFGSFTIKTKNGSEVSNDNTTFKKYFIYKSLVQLTNFSQLCKFISDEYQLLKSGKNYPKYEKSELFKYFVSKNIRWEKRFFKLFINNPVNRILNKELFWDKKPGPIDIESANGNIYNDYNDKQKNDYRYIRALFGLAEQFEYNIFNEINGVKTNNRKGNNHIDFQKKYIVKLEHKPKIGKEKIERFKSPICYKVIDGFVYISIDDSYIDLLNEQFEFTLELKGDPSKTIKKIGSLNTPSVFELKDFLDSIQLKNWKKL